MNIKIKKIWNWLTTALVVLVVLLAILLVGTRFIGWKGYTVLSGSMEPNYPVGSLIFVREVDPYELEVKDVITFMVDENVVATHRIVEVIPNESDSTVIYFRTKGDANSSEDDNLVHCKNVIGTPVFTIPWIGYVANFIQNPPGTYFAIAICVIMILLMFVPDLFRKEEKVSR